MASDNLINVAGGSVIEETSPPCSEETISAIFLGRWVLIDSKISTPMISFKSGEMTVKHQKNEETGEDEYVTDTKWTMRLCCFPYRGSSTSITRLTGKDTFTVNFNKANVVDGLVDYGKREGNNKFKTVGKKGTNEVEYKGDMCYMKITDARYSLYIEQEWKRVAS